MALAQIALPFPWYVVLIVLIVAFLLIRTAMIHRRHSMETDQRICRGCGTSHPAFAEFCRRCGRKL